jgi:hypothetical protein
MRQGARGPLPLGALLTRVQVQPYTELSDAVCGVMQQNMQDDSPEPGLRPSSKLPRPPAPPGDTQC